MNGLHWPAMDFQEFGQEQSVILQLTERFGLVQQIASSPPAALRPLLP